MRWLIDDGHFLKGKNLVFLWSQALICLSTLVSYQIQSLSVSLGSDQTVHESQSGGWLLTNPLYLCSQVNNKFRAFYYG